MFRRVLEQKRKSSHKYPSPPQAVPDVRVHGSLADLWSRSDYVYFQQYHLTQFSRLRFLHCRLSVFLFATSESHLLLLILCRLIAGLSLTSNSTIIACRRNFHTTHRFETIGYTGATSTSLGNKFTFRLPTFTTRACSGV